MHFRRVVNAQAVIVDVQHGQRLGMPGLITGFAQNPIQNRLLWPVR